MLEYGSVSRSETTRCVIKFGGSSMDLNVTFGTDFRAMHKIKTTTTVTIFTIRTILRTNKIPCTQRVQSIHNPSNINTGNTAFRSQRTLRGNRHGCAVVGTIPPRRRSNSFGRKDRVLAHGESRVR